MKVATYEDFQRVGSLREEQREALCGFEGVPGAWANIGFYARVNHGKNKSFVEYNEDGEVLAIFGYMNLFCNTYDNWMLVNGDVVSKAPKEALKIIRTGKEYVAALPKGRHQTTVRVDFPRGQKFMEALGFCKEGLMKQYINDLDVYMYSYIKD